MKMLTLVSLTWILCLVSCLEQELTHGTVERFMEENDWSSPEYLISRQKEIMKINMKRESEVMKMEMENLRHEMKEELAAMKIKLENQETKILSLQKESRDQKSEIAVLKRKIANNTQEEDNCKIIGQDRKTEGSASNSVQIESKKVLNRIWTNRVQRSGVKLEGRSMKRLLISNGSTNAGNSKRMGFTAELSKIIPNLSHGYTLKFDRVITNEGTAYNALTGVFTCKEPGLYYFSFSVVTNVDNTELSVSLMHNGVRAVTSIADPKHVGHESVAVAGAVLKMDVGQTVWLEADYLEGSPNLYHKYSNFAGFLITA